jgi:hypothetical protein
MNATDHSPEHVVLIVLNNKGFDCVERLAKGSNATMSMGFERRGRDHGTEVDILVTVAV